MISTLAWVTKILQVPTLPAPRQRSFGTLPSSESGCAPPERTWGERSRTGAAAAGCWCCALTQIKQLLQHLQIPPPRLPHLPPMQPTPPPRQAMVLCRRQPVSVISVSLLHLYCYQTQAKKQLYFTTF